MRGTYIKGSRAFEWLCRPLRRCSIFSSEQPGACLSGFLFCSPEPPISSSGGLFAVRNVTPPFQGQKEKGVRSLLAPREVSSWDPAPGISAPGHPHPSSCSVLDILKKTRSPLARSVRQTLRGSAASVAPWPLSPFSTPALQPEAKRDYVPGLFWVETSCPLPCLPKVRSASFGAL